MEAVGYKDKYYVGGLESLRLVEGDRWRDTVHMQASFDTDGWGYRAAVAERSSSSTPSRESRAAIAATNLPLSRQRVG